MDTRKQNKNWTSVDSASNAICAAQRKLQCVRMAIESLSKEPGDEFDAIVEVINFTQADLHEGLDKVESLR